MNTNDGGPAFPHAKVDMNGWAEDQLADGMSLRDYFAARAIPMAAECEANAPTGARGETTYQGIAERCYLLADAMLAAREAKP